MNAGQLPSKRQRACDICRTKKARCDGPYRSDRQCSNCVVQDFNCTYVEQSTRRVPSKKYIEGLEHRLEELEKVLRRLCPVDNIYEDWIESLTKDTVSPGPQSTPRPDPDLVKTVTHSIRASDGEAWLHHHALLQDDEDRSIDHASSLETDRFFGKSSGEVFVRTALSIKHHYIGGLERPILANRREEFWSPRPWESKPEVNSPRRYTFPDADLAKELIELYFSHVNLHTPLLHRSSLERSLRDGLHYMSADFADIYLLVCAIGARFSIALRVCPDGVDSAGWNWYLQVETGKASFLALPSLYDIQVACLRILFILNTSAPRVVWPLIGIAIRLAQDVGVHRRKTTAPTAEDELWKRAFWVLLYIDRLASLYYGRPLTVQEEDFDLDMIIDCDDEYWEHPDPRKRFKQPPNKPSLITAFILQLKITNIWAACSRVIYPINKATMRLGLIDKHCKANTVAELDSSLNQWLASMPDHLSWDAPNQPNEKFFRQSATLYASCYLTQIFIHRPPMSSLKGRPSPPPPPASFVICVNAARACIRIADALLRRGVLPQFLVQVATFTSSLVLLLDIWATMPRSHLSPSPEESLDMEHVRRGVEVFKSCEHQWSLAGKLGDIISSLLPVDKQSNLDHDKRAESPSSSSSTPVPHPSELRTPAARPEAARQLALVNEILTGTSCAEENYWKYGPRASSYPYISDEHHLLLPTLLPLDLSGSSASLSSSIPGDSADTTMDPMNAHKCLPGEVHARELRQELTVAGDPGFDKSADVFDIWANVPPELGSDPDGWHEHVAGMQKASTSSLGSFAGGS